MGKTVDVIVRLKDQVSKKLPTINDNLYKSFRNVEKFGYKMQASGRRMEAMGRNALSVTAPVVGLGAMAIKTGMEFDKSMSKVQAVSGATSKELLMLRNRAMEIGKSTSKSASDAADAMTFLAQAGYKTNEIMKASSPLVNLAVAGNMDMARTTDLWVGAVKSANIPLAKNQEFLDQLAKTANTTNSNIGELMESWQTAGASIQNSNMTMAETNGLFGILANASIKGSEAGTVVSRVFQRMNEASGESAKAMAKLKINVADSNGVLRNKIDVLRELKEKTAKLTEAERAQYLQAIGGKQYSEQLQQMLNGLGPSFDTLTGGINKSSGSLKQMTKTMSDNLFGDITTLKSKFEAAMIHISEALKPMAREWIKKISVIMEKLANLDPSIIRLVANITKWVVAIGVFNIAMGKVKQTLGGTIISFGRLGKYLVGTKAGGKNLISTMTGIISKGKSLMGLLVGMGPIGWAITAALIIGVPIIIRNWKKISKAISDTFKWIVNAASKTKSSIEKFYNSFKGTAIGKAFQPFIDSVKKTFDSLKTIFEGVGTLLVGIFTGDVNKSMKGISKIIDGACKMIVNSWKMVMNIFLIPIRASINVGKEVFKKGVDFVKDKWKSLKEAFHEHITGKVKAKASAFLLAVKNAISMWKKISSLLKNAISGKIACISDAFHKAIDKVKEAWNNVKEFLKNPIQGVVKLFQNNEADGSHAGGLGRVPFDGYRAILHKDEMVLTRSQAESYRNNKRKSVAIGSKKIVIGKIADTLNVNNKTDAEYLAKKLAEEIELAV